MIRARRIFATLLFSLSILLVGAPSALPASSDAGYNNSKILEFMNAERQERGVRAVSRDSTLDQKAQVWAEKLAAEGKMYHSSSYAAMSVGYRSGAQNLAYYDNTLSAAQAHNMWMASGVHRKNMLDPDFTNVGIAIVCSAASGRPYVMAVVEFGGEGSPSSTTPDRTPQVAGGSGNARAMSCDESSPGPAVAATSPTTPAPSPPSTTTTEVPKTNPKSVPTTAVVVKSNLPLKAATTSTRPATPTSALGNPVTSTTRPTQVVAGGTVIETTTTTTSTPVGPIPANLAAAEQPSIQPGPFAWLRNPVTWLMMLAGGAALIWKRSLRGGSRHSPKHSIGRKGRIF